jgi:hypothetical protein
MHKINYLIFDLINLKGMSTNKSVPINTKNVPNQWLAVNGFWK